MDGMKCLTMALTMCVVFASCTQAQNSDDPNGEEEPAVTIALTKLDVNDTELKLSWKIKNNTDHEVWICETMTARFPAPFLERFLDEDARTLVIRKRFDLPIDRGPFTLANPTSRYVRLRSGEEKDESVFIALPVEPDRLSTGQAANAEYAERLALEIGFYDQSLPGLILEIVELAEFLNCNIVVGLGDNVELGKRFFGGRQIAQYYDHIIGFGPNVRSADADGEMWMLHMGETRMGEKVLRIEVDGVSIPYNDKYFPLSSQGAKNTKDQQNCDTSKSNKDKPTRKKG